MFKIIIKNNKEIINEGFTKTKEFCYYNAGEIFYPENFCIDKLYKSIKSSKLPSKLLGEFSYIFDDEDSVYIINDEVGTIKWYYFMDNNNFMVSNNFWEIVNYIEPTVRNINKESIYEQMLLDKTLDGSTFIKGIKIILPGSLIIYSKKEHKLKIKNYMDIIYKESNNLSKEILFDKIESLFSKTIREIKEKNNNPKIGLTISGGLDSRFPLPFIDKKDIKISYLIGKQNNILKPFDYKNAIKMAKMYGLKFKMIDPFSTTLNDKILIDILRNPTGGSNILKSIDYNVAFNQNKFDVLITGAYGGLIGGKMLNDDILNAMEIKEFSKKMFYTYSTMNAINSFKIKDSFIKKYKRRLIKAINLIFNTNLRIKKIDKIKEVENFISDNFLFDSKYKKQILSNFENYLSFEKNKNKNNLSIIMKFHISIHSIRGSFESLHGQVKAYSIYYPYIYEFSKTWPAKYLKNRYIMEEYLFDKYKELAAIPLQSYGLSIKDKFTKLNKFALTIKKLRNLFNFMLRGLSINYTKWFLNKNLQEKIKDTFNNEYKFFYSIFNKNDIDKILSLNQYTQFADDLFKMKILIDLIESKKYKELLKKDNFRKTSKY